MNVEFSVASSSVEFYPSVIYHGDLGDIPFDNFISSGLEFYSPFAYRVDMLAFLPIPQRGFVLPPFIIAGASSGSPVLISYEIDQTLSREFFNASIDQTDRDVVFDSFIDELEIYRPIVSYSLRILNFLGPIDDSEVFSPRVFRDTVFDEAIDSTLSFYPYYVQSVNDITFSLLPPLSLKTYVFEPTLEAGAIEIEFDDFIPRGAFVYRPVLQVQRNFPVRFKRAESPLGGDITSENVFSGADYLPVVGTSEYDSISDFRYSFARGVLPSYIPSTDALFSKTFYRGIYVKNDSPFESKSGLVFWVDGGHSYRIQNSLVDKIEHEALHIYEAEKTAHGASFTTDEEREFIFGGAGRTSLFGQLKVSYLISNTRVLYPFNEDGVGLGINLSSQSFMPGNQKSSLPDLDSQEYVGIYLKIEATFSPDFPIKTDYSFFHLSYVGEDSELYEIYPSQLRGSSGLVSLMLPSTSLRVGTDYERLNSYLSSENERLYNRYPPFFTPLEDVSK